MPEKVELASAVACLSGKKYSRTWSAVKAKTRILREASRTVHVIFADMGPRVC